MNTGTLAVQSSYLCVSVCLCVCVCVVCACVCACVCVCVCVQVAVEVLYVAGSIVPSRRKTKPPPTSAESKGFLTWSMRHRQATHRWKVKTLSCFFSVLCVTLKDPKTLTYVSDTLREEKKKRGGGLCKRCLADPLSPYTWRGSGKCTQKRKRWFTMGFCMRVKCPDGQWDTSLAFVYLVQRNVWFPNSNLDKQHADNQVLRSWKGKEFIEGWGLSCWL